MTSHFYLQGHALNNRRYSKTMTQSWKLFLSVLCLKITASRQSRLQLKATKDIQHCLERGISRIFVSTLAFACFPMSFKAKCQVNWHSEIKAHCVAIQLNFLTILEKFANKFSKGGYIFIPIQYILLPCKYQFRLL